VRRGSRAHRSGAACVLLESDGLREQDIVLEVHVPVEILVKSSELSQRRTIRRAGVPRRHVALGELANAPHLVAGGAMLALHHPNRIFDRPKRARDRRPVPVRCERRDIGKEHLLLFQHVLLEVACDLVEGRRNLRQLRVPMRVYPGDLREMTADHRRVPPDVGVMSGRDMRDEALHGPGGHILRIVIAGERVQRALHGHRIDRRGAAGVRDRAPASAAEVDSELLEDARGPEVGRDDVSDNPSFERLKHDFPCISEATGARRMEV